MESQRWSLLERLYHHALELDESREAFWQTAWIFSTRKNESSMRGIRKAGFVYRLSLVRKKLSGRSNVSRQDPIQQSP